MQLLTTVDHELRKFVFSRFLPLELSACWTYTPSRGEHNTAKKYVKNKQK